MSSRWLRAWLKMRPWRLVLGGWKYHENGDWRPWRRSSWRPPRQVSVLHPLASLSSPSLPPQPWSFGPRKGICAPTTTGITELAHFSPWDSSTEPNNLFQVRKHTSDPHFSISNVNAHLKAGSTEFTMYKPLQVQAVGQFGCSRWQGQESEGKRGRLGFKNCAEHFHLPFPSLNPPRLPLKGEKIFPLQNGDWFLYCPLSRSKQRQWTCGELSNL